MEGTMAYYLFLLLPLIILGGVILLLPEIVD